MSEAKSVVTRSAEETIAWGREFARGLKAPLLVLLTGDLGSGKTTLTKGIVAGLGAAEEEDVTSPTFTLVHVYGDDGGVSERDGFGCWFEVGDADKEYCLSRGFVSD